MKKSKKYVALMMLAAMAMMVFAGCGNDEADSSATSSSAESTSAEPEADTTDEEETEASDAILAKDAQVIGAVTLTDGETLTIDYYEAEGTSLNLLEATNSDFGKVGNTTMVTISDMSSIERVEDGALVSAEADDIHAGDMIAVIDDGDGGKKIIILDVDPVEVNSDSDVSSEDAVEPVEAEVPADENTTPAE